MKEVEDLLHTNTAAAPTTTTKIQTHICTARKHSTNRVQACEKKTNTKHPYMFMFSHMYTEQIERERDAM